MMRCVAGIRLLKRLDLTLLSVHILHMNVFFLREHARAMVCVYARFVRARLDVINIVQLNSANLFFDSRVCSSASSAWHCVGGTHYIYPTMLIVIINISYYWFIYFQRD